MGRLYHFLAVVGYFRSSGYFKLRNELGDVSDIRILIGINADNIFRKHNLGWEMLEAPEKAKQLYNEQVRQDIIDGKLISGEKLPSKRSFAKNLGVSTITIENAYAQLLSEGYIYSIPKKGFYVSDFKNPIHIKLGSFDHKREIKCSAEYLQS